MIPIAQAQTWGHAEVSRCALDRTTLSDRAATGAVSSATK